VPKKDIRQNKLNERLSLDPVKIAEYSQQIQDRIMKTPFWPKTGKIGLYYPIKNEVLTLSLFQKALETGLQVYFPRVEQGISFYEVNGPDELEKGSWGIAEPQKHCDPLIEEENLDLVIVPGVAFSKSCFRIGYGKRFYDQFLDNKLHKTTAIGLAYDFQVLDDFPVDSWDQPLHGIMTEKNYYSLHVQKI